MKRKLLNRRRIFRSLVFICLLLLGYAIFIEPRMIEVERITVTLPNLPASFNGMTIAQLSDLHRRSVLDDFAIRKAVALVNGLSPDMIVLTGDYSARSGHGTIPCARILASLQAPEGVYAVLGNHDMVNPSLAETTLSHAGIHVLRNTSIELRRHDAMLYLVGMDSYWIGLQQIEQVMKSTTANVCTILLIHEPDFADTAAKYPIDLQLSGHSHGGQGRLPFIGGLIYPPGGERYPQGLRRVRHLQVYTNRGIGMTGPPLRFLCRPEVTYITLRAKNAE